MCIVVKTIADEFVPEPPSSTAQVRDSEQQSKFATPAQDALHKTIAVLQADIASLVCRENINALKADDMKK